MEIFTDAGLALLVRWLHILAGITWIGLLYYFNFVQGPAFAEFEAGPRTEAIRKLVPRALWWFRWSAAATWAAGVAMIFLIHEGNTFEYLGSPQGLPILTGMLLGTIMFLNVWGVIWRKQKIVIASAEATASGGQANPAAADAGRRALLTSRTNVVFSIPMLFFMAASSHLGLVPASATSGSKMTYWLIAIVVIAAVELNALMGLTGAMKKPLEKVNTVIWAGVILWVILYGLIELVLNS